MRMHAALGLSLEKVVVLSETLKSTFHTENGFTNDLAVAIATGDDIILAYKKDGESLPEKLRLAFPRIWRI
jgi:DMSO/TMAO reductase YedYZ molybdopterin-dependent catalytic subunit